MNLEVPQGFWKESPLHEKVYSIFENSPIKFKIISGQQVDGGKLILGTRRALYDFSLDALIHEIAHLIEVEDHRVLSPVWGFSFREKPLETSQATRRELRTIAIQARLYEYFSHNWTPQKDLSALKWMPDVMNVPGNTEEEKFETRKAWFNEYLQSHSKESVIQELQRKIYLLNNNKL